MKNHVKISLNTLDLNPDCVILTLGAVIFDLRKMEIGEAIYLKFDRNKQKNRKVSKATIDFWNKPENDEARKEAMNGKLSLKEGLEELEWFLPPDCKVWGNGSIFEISILQNAHIQCEMPIPWHHWNVLDMRTLKKIYEAKRGGFDTANRKGIRHNSLDDAMNQTNDILKMWASVMK